MSAMCGMGVSCVIITRLPFAQPTHPLEEARREWFESQGRNFFKEYQLPQAVVKFRQGFGRLIRSKTDTGAIVILDPRIKTQPYGSSFLRSIPSCHEATSMEEVEEFLNLKGSG